MKFLLNTITDWSEPPRARHQIAYELSKRFPVVFVSGNKIGTPRIKSLIPDINLEVIIPYFPFHAKLRIRIPLINRLYQKWLYHILLKKYKNHIVINFDFTAKYLHEYFHRTIYYCNDDHIGMSYKFNPKFIADYQSDSERTVAQESIFCVATSEFLKKKLSPYNQNVFEIRLGAPNTENINVDTSIQKKDGIHVGFVGFLHTANIHLLKNILKNKEFRFTLIGPARSKEVKMLMQYGNIQFTGTLTGQSLYNEIGKIDVGIIPYGLSSEIDRTPNKLWLYLAMGKPVVITNIAGIKNWIFPERFVYRANSAEEFNTYIRKACAENNQSLVEQRIQFARNNSWENRMNQLIEILKTYHEVIDPYDMKPNLTKV